MLQTPPSELYDFTTFCREREQERERRLRVLFFHSMTRPWALSLFPLSNCNSLFRRRTERKNRACDVRAWCGHWKEFSKFLSPPLEEKTGLGGEEGGGGGGGVIKSSRTVKSEEQRKGKHETHVWGYLLYSFTSNCVRGLKETTGSSEMWIPVSCHFHNGARQQNTGHETLDRLFSLQLIM